MDRGVIDGATGLHIFETFQREARAVGFLFDPRRQGLLDSPGTRATELGREVVDLSTSSAGTWGRHHLGGWPRGGWSHDES
jgi:hypothetical protein